MKKAKIAQDLPNGLPEFCYVSSPAYPDQVNMVKRGHKGYFPSHYTGGKAKAIALNADLGVTMAQMEAMMAGSMFGFHVKAANPALYDEKGELTLTV